jgi:hypothetical protein
MAYLIDCSIPLEEMSVKTNQIAVTSQECNKFLTSQSQQKPTPLEVKIFNQENSFVLFAGKNSSTKPTSLELHLIGSVSSVTLLRFNSCKNMKSSDLFGETKSPGFTSKLKSVLPTYHASKKHFTP